MIHSEVATFIPKQCMVASNASLKQSAMKSDSTAPAQFSDLMQSMACDNSMAPVATTSVARPVNTVGDATDVSMPSVDREADTADPMSAPDASSTIPDHDGSRFDECAMPDLNFSAEHSDRLLHGLQKHDLQSSHVVSFEKTKTPGKKTSVVDPLPADTVATPMVAPTEFESIAMTGIALPVCRVSLQKVVTSESSLRDSAIATVGAGMKRNAQFSPGLKLPKDDMTTAAGAPDGANAASAIPGRNDSMAMLQTGEVTHVRSIGRVDSSPEESGQAIVVVDAVPSLFRASIVSESHSSEPFQRLHGEADELPDPVAQPVHASPMHRLDLQWSDAGLGVVSLKAEMRDGVLHADVKSEHASSCVNATELHQFLEEARVVVHSLHVNGVTARSSVVARASEPSTDTNAFMGSGSQTSSRREQGRPRTLRQESEQWNASIAPDSGSTLQSVMPFSTVPTAQKVQGVSIHI